MPENTESQAAQPAVVEQPEPVVETVADEPEQAPVEKPAEDDAAKQDAEAKEQPRQELPDRALRRINKLTARVTDATERATLAEARAAALEARIAELGIDSPTEAAQKTEDPREIAKQYVEAEKFLNRSNEVYSAGKKAFENFDQKIANLRAVSDPADFRNLMEAVVDYDAAPALVNYLGSHLDEAEDIATLPVRQQARELARIEARLAAVPKVSNAPPPIKPIGTRGSAVNTNLENATQAEFEAIRKKQGARWAR